MACMPVTNLTPINHIPAFSFINSDNVGFLLDRSCMDSSRGGDNDPVSITRDFGTLGVARFGAIIISDRDLIR